MSMSAMQMSMCPHRTCSPVPHSSDQELRPEAEWGVGVASACGSYRQRTASRKLLSGPKREVHERVRMTAAVQDGVLLWKDVGVLDTQRLNAPFNGPR